MAADGFLLVERSIVPMAIIEIDLNQNLMINDCC